MNLKILDTNHSRFLRKAMFSAGVFLAGTFGLLAQHAVTGRVSDDSGALSGVNVVVKGTNTGALSGADGTYSINVPDNDATLLFSIMGYAPLETVVGSRTVIDVTMVEEAEGLDEVVVVGYGTQKKVNLTGAVTSVSGRDVASKATTDVLSALQGQMPGVAVLRSSGQPGAETSGLRIRGFSSANEADALVLIDGLEGSLTLLNPEDIESVSVLKDAAAASIYGARAAAGVVLVTTKKGSSDKLKISYNGSFGLNLPGNMPQRMAPWEEQNFINAARYADRGSPEQNPEQTSWIGNPNFNYYPNGTRWTFHTNSNWINDGTKDYTTQHNHSVSVGGGHGATRYYVSGGYFAKNGILKYGPDDYSRLNLRANMNTEMGKHVDFNLQVSYESSRQNQNPMGAATVLSYLYNSRGRQAIYLPEEDTNYESNPYSSDLQVNAIDAMKNGGVNTSLNQYFTGNANLRVKDLVKGLTLDLNLSRRAGFYGYESDRPYRPGMGRNGVSRNAYEINNPNRVVKIKNGSYQDKLEALLNYDLRLSEHSFHVLAGASYERYLKDEISAEARNLLSNDFFSLNYYDNTLATNTIVGDLVQPWKMASLFGRVNYDYAGRYLFEANLRYDGSSRLAPGNRWGLFPSASLGWRVSEEAFFESLRATVGNFKLRFSWGQLGNSTVLNSMYYPYYGLISNKTEDSNSTVLSVMGNPVYYQKAMVSKDVTWETLTSTNIGVDLGFFGNRLNLTADYYWKSNDNMLAQLRVGNIAGVVQLPYQNVGKLKTWGWEVSIAWRDKIGNVAYNVSFNIDDSRNELLGYAGSNVIKAGSVDKLEGYPLNTIWGYRTDGFWNSAEEYQAYKADNPGYQSFNDAKISGGDVRYVAQGKPDHTVGIGGGTPEEPGDLVYLGTSNARYLYGINLGAEWKGFDFSCFFQGVGQRTFLIDQATLTPLGVSYEMPWTIHRDYWTPENPNAFFARPYEGNTFNYHPSDRWVQNGAYVRLKNIQLGYSVPVAARAIEKLRVYVSGTDVWEHSNVLKVFDPETPNGKNSQYYPFFRTWTIGVNLTF